MSSKPRDWYRRYRLLFLVAAAYNITFGVWSGFFPDAFFRWFEMPPPGGPVPWPVMAAVVCLLGVLYAAAAWCPDRADVIVAIGLTSKIAGPLGWLVAVADGSLPPRMFPLVLVGDVLWWFPFLFYLLRQSHRRATIVVAIAVAFHIAACVGLLVIAPGTEMTPDISQRQQWVLGAPGTWTAVWMVWSLASMSLLALCIVWAERLKELASSSVVAVLACAIVAVGVGCDLFGECVMIVWGTRANISVNEFAEAMRWYQLLSPAAANGLYCIGGLMLSSLSWKNGWLRGTPGVVGFVMWIMGLGLTAATLVEHRIGMIVAGGAVMLLFIPWATVLGWRLRKS